MRTTTGPATNENGRLIHSTPEIDQAELKWWSEFSEAENRFCWVQPPQIHRIIRQHYVTKIAQLCKGAKRILDLGCGTGWLSRMIAQAGTTNLVGLDFSPAQINTAIRETESAGLSERISFTCAPLSEVTSKHGPFDAIIIHGFLHHLSVTELHNTLEDASRCLPKNGRILIFEPFRRAPRRKSSLDLEQTLQKAFSLRTIVTGKQIGRAHV